jgi:hypothetical protein
MHRLLVFPGKTKSFETDVVERNKGCKRKRLVIEQTSGFFLEKTEARPLWRWEKKTECV